MNRKLSTLVLCAVLAGAGLGGCAGSGPADAPSSVQVAAAVRSAAHEMDPQDPMDTAGERDAAVSKFMGLLNELRELPVLAPLFEQYQIPYPVVVEDDLRSAGLVELLAAVRITVSAGTVTLTNRATGVVIYSAPLSDLSSGTFDPGNVPTTGTATPPPPPATCSAFTYSAWSACQSSNTQTRTVLTSSPSACTGGTPVTSQSCTYVPPSPPPPSTCTSFTYSAWGACQANGTQTRTVMMSSPSGCTGGSPVTTQACTYVPPVTTCSAFTYSAWGACQSSNTQTRTVLTSSPSGCTGGSPVTTQACTYVPPACTYTYAAWGACQASGTQTRTVASSSPTGCSGTPVLSQSCTYTAPNPVTFQNVVSSCTMCHGLTSNTTVFKPGGYTVSGRSAAQWLTTVNSMVSRGAPLAPGTTAQNYADYLANVP